MRTCRRNRTKIYYANYKKEQPLDRYGNRGNEYEEPQEIYVNLSVDTGNADYAAFGKDLDFDRFCSVSLKTCPITEYSHLWIDIEPTEPFNYIVRREVHTRRESRYAIKRVTNNGN